MKASFLTLFVACLLIYHFGMSVYWYVVAFFLFFLDVDQSK